MSKRKQNKKDYLVSDRKIYSNRVDIFLTDNVYTFEVADTVTDDILEGIVLCMLYENDNSEVWNMEIDRLYLGDINPVKSLYWLSGGKNEWSYPLYYNLNWSEAYPYFENEYAMLLIEILLESGTFREVRNLLIDHLNLVILYEFALSKNLIKI